MLEAHSIDGESCVGRGLHVFAVVFNYLVWDTVRSFGPIGFGYV